MNDCIGCKYAQWDKRAGGNLHPSGDGLCTVKIKIPALPASKYWINSAPCVGGGSINRRESFNEHCKYFQNKEAAIAHGKAMCGIDPESKE
jgi:hypothetical protein